MLPSKLPCTLPLSQQQFLERACIPSLFLSLATICIFSHAPKFPKPSYPLHPSLVSPTVWDTESLSRAEHCKPLYIKLEAPSAYISQPTHPLALASPKGLRPLLQSLTQMISTVCFFTLQYSHSGSKKTLWKWRRD